MVQRLTGIIAVVQAAGAVSDSQWLNGSHPRIDGISQLILSSSFMMNGQLAFGVTPRDSSVAKIANPESRRFDGSQTGFTIIGACTYGSVTNGSSGDVANTDNPGTPVQPFMNASYTPAWTSISTASTAARVDPFDAYVNVRITL